jgi:phosphatidylserine/phosphatidylglycerophosphate/cardiolipin synthase-like enzyme
MIAFASRAELIGAVGRARRVEVSSWQLPSTNPLVDALEAAGDRGCDVRVTLERAPWVPDPVRRDALQRANLATVDALEKHHVAARLSDEDSAPLHLKAAVVDGRAFLAQRNWAKDETLVTTADGADAAAIAAAIEQRPRDTGDLALRKDHALALEARLIRDAPPGAAIECETESFGASCVSDALLERARRGEGNMRLILNGSALAERALPRAAAETLAALRAAGIAIERSRANGKFCVAGNEVWLGSANATAGQGRTLDWGMRTSDPAIAAALQARFERDWRPA